MTDEILGDSVSVTPESQQQAVPVENVSQEAQASVPTNQGVAQAPQEKLLNQTDVNNMIAGAKRKAYDKGLEAGRQTEQAPQGVANNTGVGLGESQISSMIESKMAEMAKQQQENLANHNNREKANRIVADLTSKMESARKNTPDYDEVMGVVNNFNDTPAILEAVHTFDNAGEILYHLGKNLKDLPAINALALSFQNRPGEVNLASTELKKISDRLKQNENGKNSAYAPEPIKKIETNLRDGIGDGTPKSIADYKHVYIG